MSDDQEYTVSATRRLGDFTITHERTYRKAEPEVIPYWVTPQMILEREEYFAEAARMGHGVEWNGPWWPPEPPSFKRNPKFVEALQRFAALRRSNHKTEPTWDWASALQNPLPQAWVPAEEHKARLREKLDAYLAWRL